MIRVGRDLKDHLLPIPRLPLKKIQGKGLKYEFSKGNEGSWERGAGFGTLLIWFCSWLVLEHPKNSQQNPWFFREKKNWGNKGVQDNFWSQIPILGDKPLPVSCPNEEFQKSNIWDKSLPGFFPNEELQKSNTGRQIPP